MTKSLVSVELLVTPAASESLVLAEFLCDPLQHLLCPVLVELLVTPAASESLVLAEFLCDLCSI